MKALLRASLASLVGSAALFSSSLALAMGENCLNDTDCPGAECGGEVCNWNLTNPVANIDKPYTCNPAGTDPKGKDGWCSDKDSNFCKCKAQGATCGTNFFYCSFTKPSDAPAGGGGSGSGGSGSSTAGTGSATAGSSSATAGSSSATAGSSSTTAGSSSGGSGSTPAPAAADEGGCSVSAPGRSNTGLALGALAALGLVLSRRRR